MGENTETPIQDSRFKMWNRYSHRRISASRLWLLFWGSTFYSRWLFTPFRWLNHLLTYFQGLLGLWRHIRAYSPA